MLNFHDVASEMKLIVLKACAERFNILEQYLILYTFRRNQKEKESFPVQNRCVKGNEPAWKYGFLFNVSIF